MAVFNWKTSKTTSMSCLGCFNALEQFQGFTATQNNFLQQNQKNSNMDSLEPFYTEMALEAL